MSKVVELFTPDGDLVVYKPLSARLPAFLAVYGPQQGYSVETELLDTLHLKPGLMQLYEIVLHAGRKPEEVGLPGLMLVGQTLVCRATLRDRDGRVWATATAAKLIQAYKDLEVLETAARQRLLAALGFGGEVLDRDEHQDQAAQGLVTPSPALASKPAAAAIARASTADAADAKTEPAMPSARPDAPASDRDAGGVASTADAADAKTEPAMPFARPGAPASDRDAAALAALVRQIQQQARLRGIEPPVVTTRQAAQAALQHLLRRA